MKEIGIVFIGLGGLGLGRTAQHLQESRAMSTLLVADLDIVFITDFHDLKKNNRNEPLTIEQINLPYIPLSFEIKEFVSAEQPQIPQPTKNKGRGLVALDISSTGPCESDADALTEKWHPAMHET